MAHEDRLKSLAGDLRQEAAAQREAAEASANEEWAQAALEAARELEADAHAAERGADCLERHKRAGAQESAVPRAQP